MLRLHGTCLRAFSHLKVRTKVQTIWVCVFVTLFTSDRLVLVSRCSYARTLKKYIWHTALRPVVINYTCNWLVCGRAGYVVFPFPGSDDSLPELLVFGPKVQTIQETFSHYKRTEPCFNLKETTSLVGPRFKLNFGSDQAEKHKSPDQTR